MKNFLVFALGAVLALAALWPEPPEPEPPEAVSPEWSLLWSGFWEKGGNLAPLGRMTSRGDLRLLLPWQDLSLRAQLTDKRSLPPWEEEGLTAFGGGAYHGPTGSRLLHGILDEYGLPARIRNPWAKSVPFTEYHRPSVYDLKTEPSSTHRPENYLYLGSPSLKWEPVPGEFPWQFRGFGSVLLDEDMNAAFGAGLEARWGKKSALRLEGFYTRRELPPRTVSAWFSASPPLPERDFRIHALGLVFDIPLLGIAADGAWSETFAYGRDIYANLGLRLGDKPWRLSLATDGAGSRYVGRDGAATGAGFRTAARLERRGVRTGLFRLGTTFRGPAFEEPFERSSSQIYYRFPTARGSSVSLSRLSLDLNRDARDREKILDSAEALMAFNTGPLKWAFSGTLTALDSRGSSDERPSPFPLPDFFAEFAEILAPGEADCFSSAKVSGEFSWSPKGFFKIPGTLQIKPKLTYTVKKDKDSVWDPSLYLSWRGKRGRLSFKIAAPDFLADDSPKFPENLTYTLSWRLEKK